MPFILIITDLKRSFVVRDENSMAKTVSFDDNIN